MHHKYFFRWRRIRNILEHFFVGMNQGTFHISFVLDQEESGHLTCLCFIDREELGHYIDGDHTKIYIRFCLNDNNYNDKEKQTSNKL